MKAFQEQWVQRTKGGTDLEDRTKRLFRGDGIPSEIPWVSES